MDNEKKRFFVADTLMKMIFTSVLVFVLLIIIVSVRDNIVFPLEVIKHEVGQIHDAVQELEDNCTAK